MSDIAYPYREDRSCSGFFEFTQTGVQYADTGIVNHKHYMSFDQGPWTKLDSSGSSLYELDLDTGNFRVSDSLTCVSAGTHGLYRRMQIPRDYGTWSSLTFFTRKNTGTITSLAASVLKNGVVDPGVSSINVLPSVANVWEQFTLTPTATYNPGDFITVRLVFVSGAAGAEVFVADWSSLYVTDKVNV